MENCKEQESKTVLSCAKNDRGQMEQIEKDLGFLIGHELTTEVVMFYRNRTFKIRLEAKE